jgi:hypothetical protein
MEERIVPTTVSSDMSDSLLARAPPSALRSRWVSERRLASASMLPALATELWLLLMLSGGVALRPLSSEKENSGPSAYTGLSSLARCLSSLTRCFSELRTLAVVAGPKDDARTDGAGARGRLPKGRTMLGLGGITQSAGNARGPAARVFAARGAVADAPTREVPVCAGRGRPRTRFSHSGTAGFSSFSSELAEADGAECGRAMTRCSCGLVCVAGSVRAGFGGGLGGRHVVGCSLERKLSVDRVFRPCEKRRVCFCTMAALTGGDGSARVADGGVAGAVK